MHINPRRIFLPEDSMFDEPESSPPILVSCSPVPFKGSNSQDGLGIFRPGRNNYKTVTAAILGFEFLEAPLILHRNTDGPVSKKS
jgi:hypothetical protein